MIRLAETGRVARDHVRLGLMLASYRQRAGLGGVEAGRRAGMSQAKISKLENSRAIPNLDDLHTLAAVYNMSETERDELTRLAVDVREISKRSRIVMHRGAARLQTRFGRMEAAAKLLRSFQPAMVLGILQTAAYARLVYTDAEISDEDADAAVAVRADRRAAFANTDREFRLILTEGALRWQAGSPQIMVEQIETLADISRLPNVRLGVIPWTRPVRVFCTHAFHLYDDTAAVVGTEVSSATFTEEEDVRLYVKLFAQLEELAAFGEDARRELARIGGEYRLLG